MSNLAERIRNAILADVTDRRGWGQEWNMFGDDIQEQIRCEWVRIIDLVIESERPKFTTPTVTDEQIQEVQESLEAVVES